MVPETVRAAINYAMKALPAPMTSPQAMVMLYAIGLQESRFQYRAQIGRTPGTKGPARGFWQFEKGGGCKGVINHAASRYWMHQACAAAGVLFTPEALWNAIETDDVLAASAARLLLFTDGSRLPAMGDYDAAWACYVRNWRPGKPHRETWNALYDEALALVAEESL